MKGERLADNGTQGMRVQSIDNRSDAPYLRADCLAHVTTPMGRLELQRLLEQHAKELELEHPQISVETDRLGIVGTCTGMKPMPKLNISTKVIAKIFVGINSVLQVNVFDEAPGPLAREAQSFINSVEIKPVFAVTTHPAHQRAVRMKQMVGSLWATHTKMSTMLSHCQTRQPELAAVTCPLVAVPA